MSVKTRYFSGQTAKTIRNGVVTNTSQIGGGYESVEGFGHNLSNLGHIDCGGPCRINRSITTYTTGKPSPLSNYAGSDIYPTSSHGFSRGADLSDTQVKANGTTGIARSTPTNPVFSAGTALGELHRDGIPSAIGMTTWKERTKVHLGSSGEFLNYEFGWLPLVNDIRNFAYAVRNHRDILRDFKAGSGKVTRASYNFTSSTRSEGYAASIGLRSTNAIAQGSTQGGSVVSKEETRARFTGGYTYHLPVGDAALDKAMRFGDYADKLLGVRLTPEVVWNLTPWSWGVDWFSNTGDIIHNFSTMGHDGLVLLYGYSMHRRYYTSTSGGPCAGGGYASITVRDDTYLRLPSSPYFGFGTTGTLSATQSAILVALGVNHMR